MYYTSSLITSKSCDCFCSLARLLPSSTGRSSHFTGVSPNELLTEQWLKKLEKQQNKNLSWLEFQTKQQIEYNGAGATTIALKKRSDTCLFKLGDKTSAADRSWTSAVLWSFSWCKYKYLKTSQHMNTSGRIQVWSGIVLYMLIEMLYSLFF